VAQAYNTISTNPNTNRLPNPAKHPPAAPYSLLLLPISGNIRLNPYEAKSFLIFLFVSFKKTIKVQLNIQTSSTQGPKKREQCMVFVVRNVYILSTKKGGGAGHGVCLPLPLTSPTIL
jgi:hypothetical protein